MKYSETVCICTSEQRHEWWNVLFFFCFFSVTLSSKRSLRYIHHRVRSTHNATELNNKVINSGFNEKKSLNAAWPADIRRLVMINAVCVCVCPAGPPCLRGLWRRWRSLRDVCHSLCVVARRSMNLFQSWRNRWPSRRTAARTAVSVCAVPFLLFAVSILCVQGHC